MNTEERQALIRNLQKWIPKVPRGTVRQDLVKALAELMRQDAAELESDTDSGAAE